jgi:putative glutamine amidotransferase
VQPVIGVSSDYAVDTACDPPREHLYLLAAYTDAVYAAGGLPRPLPVLPADQYDDAVLDALLADLDGVVLTGGYDLHPRHYGQPQHPTTHPLHARRDAFEVDLVRRVDASRRPLLAICLGFQILHVVRGGRLIQHVDDLPLEPAVTHHLPRERNAFHPVRIATDSTLATIIGDTTLEVPGRHHQVVDPDHQGADLRPVAWAADGIIEASEDTRDSRFLIAVQWHPEAAFDRPPQLRLFEALVAAARARH